MQAQPENPAEEIERLRRCVDDLGSLLAQRTAELAAADEALKQEAAGRSRSEAALRLHELDFLAEGQRLSSTGSFSWRVDTDEIKFSVELHRIFGLEQDAPVTFELIASRVHPEDIALLTEKIEHARAGGSDLEYDIRLRMPDGSIRYVRTIARGTKHPDGQLEYVGAVQDMTQRRLADEALAETRSELAHVARVTNLGVLTASIAHELKQPLAAIVTNGETSLRWLARAQPNVEKARELTRRVVADSRRASEIINRIRDMAARRAPEQTPVSLDEVVRESMVFLREELQARKVAVALDLAPSLPLVVGDRTQLQQVVVNLAINAAQAMAQAGAARRSILIRTMLAGPETVCCTVEDSGPGIEPENIPRLFDAFFTTKDNGMGMGLPISRSIIEALGGRISADNDSALGGARFSVALPGHLTAEPAHR